MKLKFTIPADLSKKLLDLDAEELARVMAKAIRRAGDAILEEMSAPLPAQGLLRRLSEIEERTLSRPVPGKPGVYVSTCSSSIFTRRTKT